MPHEHTLTYTTYDFDELSDAAKEKARDWWRNGENESGMDMQFSYDDFRTCGEILGITIDYRDQPWSNVSTGKKGVTREPCIYWSGFSSQGDGACFEGSYAYAKGARKGIRQHAPQDTDLHHIADALQRLQSKYFYQLTATVKHRGHYNHEYCTEITVSVPDHITAEKYQEAERILSELLRDFMRWMYRQLEKEYEYRMSDESVDENIRANGYEFTEEGTVNYLADAEEVVK